VLFSSYASAGEDGWEYVGKADNGQYVYIDIKNISYPSENTVKFLVKMPPSPEREKQIRKTFEEANKETEEEFKTKVKGTEALLNLMLENETEKFILEIDCLNNRIRRYQPNSTSVIEAVISPNSLEETIQKMTCKKR
jgi:microcompartment protein CcmL/EutN